MINKIYESLFSERAGRIINFIVLSTFLTVIAFMYISLVNVQRDNGNLVSAMVHTTKIISDTVGVNKENISTMKWEINDMNKRIAELEKKISLYEQSNRIQSK